MAAVLCEQCEELELEEHEVDGEFVGYICPNRDGKCNTIVSVERYKQLKRSSTNSTKDDSDVDDEESDEESPSESISKASSSSALSRPFVRPVSSSNHASSFMSDGKAALLKVLAAKKPAASSAGPPPIQVKRAALLPCLSIVGAEVACPKLRQQFKLPRGVVLSEADEELRRRKTLGVRLVAGAGFQPMKKIVPFELTYSNDDSAPPAPSKIIEEDYSNVEPLVLWEPSSPDQYGENTAANISVEPFLCKWLRPHQREGVRFMAECLTGQRDFEGTGSILADDMGLGKTLQSITLMYTLLKQGFTSNEPIASKCIIVCPTSLVANWANEIKKWCGDRIKCVALSESSKEKVICGIADFMNGKHYPILVISYETLRLHAERLTVSPSFLMIADEAHRLKNAETLTYTTLCSLPCKRRVLLSGTPMQNNLDEFFAMADLVNPGIFGDERAFRKHYITPILIGREPGASDKDRNLATERSTALSVIVNKFVLRRTNALLSAHLPPKVIEVVCCKMTPLQTALYEHFIRSKAVSSVLNEDQNKPISQVLPLITSLKKLCNHPKLVYDEARQGKKKANASLLEGVEDFFPPNFHRQAVSGFCPDMSGKMEVLDRLLVHVRDTTDDRCVLISNYTQTLDLFSDMCRAHNWPYVRLDGTTSVKKRQKLVDQLTDRTRDTFIFLLSSKAGGCGLNLIGANRLVLFDPDWNPAVDKQAAARVWRDGQKKRCFIYRFLSVGTIEEKVYQRQLSKEGLQSVIGAGEIEETSSSIEDLRDLFTLQPDTVSDTHDTLNCQCMDRSESQQNDGRPPLEQSGQPKEEELQDWSHHCDVATVPDPVFAASQIRRGGDPLVSFVFACEVAGCAIAGEKVKSPVRRKTLAGFELPERSAQSPKRSPVKHANKISPAPIKPFESAVSSKVVTVATKPAAAKQLPMVKADKIAAPPVEIDDESNDADSSSVDASESESEQSESDSEASMKDEQAEVECILDCRGSGKSRRYLVKWVGFSQSEATWEPEENLQSCPEILTAFEQSKKKKQSPVEIEPNTSKKSRKIVISDEEDTFVQKVKSDAVKPTVIAGSLFDIPVTTTLPAPLPRMDTPTSSAPTPLASNLPIKTASKPRLSADGPAQPLAVIGLDDDDSDFESVATEPPIQPPVQPPVRALPSSRLSLSKSKSVTDVPRAPLAEISNSNQSDEFEF